MEVVNSSLNIEDKFKEQRELVRKVLAEYPDTRDDDLTLCLKFYELKYRVRFNIPDSAHVERWESPATIIRRRQEIQQGPNGQFKSDRNTINVEMV